MYIIMPVFTLVIISSESMVYWFLEPPNPLLYSVIMNLVMILGWLVTLVFWSKCYSIGANLTSRYRTTPQWGGGMLF